MLLCTVISNNTSKILTGLKTCRGPSCHNHGPKLATFTFISDKAQLYFIKCVKEF